ncbi:fused MFS/spermidine synthase [Solimonas marina]|uniref:Fused MFS/spermidine synthase n=1 Tax=Solimonas marina TaxID=2714601 RepID=A0A969WAX3_9GAMM|nr:fused MFS/spermidine synthase [Solimonas marina]NKF23822.1 fused MFS/spermidine synthase [Solimonas marina]
MPDSMMEPLASRGWLKLPASLLDESGTLWLHERADAPISDLLELLRKGEYGKPFMIEDGGLRRLHFSLDYVQSEMRIDDPCALTFAYTRKMMAFLLFVPRPKHIISVGLGGGSLAKFCHRALPKVRITAIEIDEQVIALSELFEIPRDDPRLNIVHADAAEYLENTTERADVILIDGCDKFGVAPALGSEAFYRNAAARLSRKGVMVMNIIGHGIVLEQHLRCIASAFSGRVMVIKVSEGGNRLIFAFKEMMYGPDWTAINQQAKVLKQQHDLDFPRFVRKLRASRQFQAFG